MTSLIATLRWAVLVALILVIAGNGTLLLREISAMKAAQRMKNRLLILVIATCVIFSVFFIGVAVWAQPQVSALSVIADGTANRYSELGAAMAGGAIIAGTVLVAERLFAHDAEDRATRF